MKKKTNKFCSLKVQKQMKNSFTRGLSNRFELEENSMNLNTDQWKLYTLKSREGRNKEK